MPEATFLQIQGRDDSTTRVIELPVGPIRIGRGSLCEVRLADPTLAEVQCMLRRRGTTWHYQPVGQPGLVWIDGRPADVQRPIPLGASLRVGDSWLTLRLADQSAEVPGSFTSPITVETQTVETEPAPEPEPPRTSAPTTEDAEERLRRWQTRLEQREQWLKDRQDEKRWEARWKAAGESIRSRSTKPSAPIKPTPDRPTPAARPVEPRPATSYSRIAEPAPRPSPNRVPVRERPGPVVLPPPIARIVPRSPVSRTLVALPAPSIDWAGSRIEPVIVPPIEVETRVVEVSPILEPEPAFKVEVETPVVEVSPILEPEPVVEVVADPVPILDDSSVCLEPVGPTLEVLVDELVAEEVSQAEILVQPLEIEVEPELPTLESEPFEEPLATPLLPEISPEPEPAPSFREPVNSDPAWPSARSIFDAQGSRRGSSPVPAESPSVRKRKPEPMPTPLLAPAVWTLPGWLGLIPTTAVALVVGSVGIFLSHQWILEQSSANLAMGLATRDDKSPVPPIDPTIQPPTEWWKTTAPHLAAWAVTVSRIEGEDHSEDVRIFTEAARHASPLSASSRFAIEPAARTVSEADTGPRLDHLGRTRDIVTLTWTGRRLRESGQVQDSLRAYRTAMRLAAGTRTPLLEPPLFNDDAQVRRYRLPREAILGSVILDMNQAGKWTHEQWSEALPESADASMIASRVFLKEQDRAEADRMVDLTLARGDSPVPTGFDPAEQDAAVAEALASRLRWSEAATRYQRAIDRTGDDPTRRRWWLNLADLAQRLGDDSLRSKALESAKSPESLDEITRQALLFQQSNPGLAARSDNR